MRGRLLYALIPPTSRPEPEAVLPPLLGDAEDPAGYRPDEGMVDAVNVALMLRQPLLVTGEPGTGKTQLARSIAYQLGLGPPLNFETKSTSVAKDLFYSFDSIARFRSAQSGADEESAGRFLTFNALGEAILLASDPAQVRDLLPAGQGHSTQKRSVVLIDEIDKAPRDFPNDILNEVDRFFFRIPEFGGRTVSADPGFRPVLVLTSNSERSLPEAFLRRCIFYNIPFPDPARLEEIVLTRLGDRLAQGQPMMADALDFFLELRLPASGLHKKPGTAELLNWLLVLLEFGCDAGTSMRAQRRIARGTLYALGKQAADQDAIADRFSRWISRE